MLRVFYRQEITMCYIFTKLSQCLVELVDNAQTFDGENVTKCVCHMLKQRNFTRYDALGTTDIAVMNNL